MDIEPEECRKFSVDPNIISFEVLQSILSGELKGIVEKKIKMLVYTFS